MREQQTGEVRTLTNAEKHLILLVAERLADENRRKQLLADMANATAHERNTDGASLIIFHITGYQRPSYRGKHSFGVGGRMADRDEAPIDIDLYADENDRLLELELIRQGSGPIIVPDWSSLVLF